MKDSVTAALAGFVAGLAMLVVIALLTGCAAKKPVRMDFSIPYRVFVFTKTCQPQADGSYICKARFDPQEVKAR